MKYLAWTVFSVLIVVLWITSVTWMSDEICTNDFAPACGEKNVECIQTPCESTLTTYWNKCKLEADNAEFMYYGECREEEEVSLPDEEPVMCTQEMKTCPDGESMVARGGPNCEFAACPDSKEINCTQEFAPVCGNPYCEWENCESYAQPQTYTNKCKLLKSDAEYLYDWRCWSQQNELTQSNLRPITPEIQVKLDEIIQVMNRILNKYEWTQKEMLALKIEFKIDAIKQRKPELSLWFDYIVDNM